MYVKPQQQSKAHNEALRKLATSTPSMPSAGLPNSALLSMLGNTDTTTSQPNKTGLPDALKARFERLTSIPLDDVRVHRNSDKPAELGALAYARGSEVHIGPGQEEHLEHELGHVVQQKAGMVKPTSEIGGEPVNTDEKLEKEITQKSYPTAFVATSGKHVTNTLQMQLGVIGTTLKEQGFSEKDYLGYRAIITPIAENLINGSADNPINQYLTINAAAFVKCVKSLAFEALFDDEEMQKVISSYISLPQDVREHIEATIPGNCGELASFLYGKPVSPETCPHEHDKSLSPDKASLIAAINEAPAGKVRLIRANSNIGHAFTLIVYNDCVELIQAWQGAYNVQQWLAHGSTCFSKQDFITKLTLLFDHEIGQQPEALQTVFMAKTEITNPDDPSALVTGNRHLAICYAEYQDLDMNITEYIAAIQASSPTQRFRE